MHFKVVRSEGRILCCGIAAMVWLGFSCSKETEDLTGKVFSQAEDQTKVMLDEIRSIDPEILMTTVGDSAWKKPLTPRALKDGQLRLVPSKDWTSGFLPGELWYLYEYTGKDEWRQKAEILTAKMEREKWNDGTHDMGFKINCSFGNGYRLTNNDAYKDVITQSAKTLITRFKPAAGCLRSWDHNSDKWQCPVIIDNMMNLELLFLASKLTGDKTYYQVAVSHANATMKNHFREDNSSYHVVDYDTITGEILHKHTHQGYSHESAWSRGQAWGLYGFTMCYRETDDPTYLDHAEKIAAFILDHPNLPEDLVPYWDFDAPEIPNEPRDVSAAAVIASALYELSTYSEKGNFYKEKADEMVKNMADKYTSPPGANKGFILSNSVGSKPGNSEVDVPLSYADYYFLEALVRKNELELNGKL